MQHLCLYLNGEKPLSAQGWLLVSVVPSFWSSESSAHLLSSALTHLFSPLPSRCSWGRRRVTLVYFHIPSLCFVESVTSCVLKAEVERESEDFLFSLSAHCTVTLHAEFAFTQRNKIIKDSCKTQNEISIVQGHYKGSVRWEATLRWMSNIVIIVIVFCPCVEGRSQQYKIVGKITADGAMLLCRRTLWAHNSKLRLPSTSYYKHEAVLEVKNLQIYNEK